MIENKTKSFIWFIYFYNNNRAKNELLSLNN